MKKHLSILQFIGFAFTVFLGTILHFVYNWTCKSIIFAPISAINESTWEHMKIMFFPLVLFAIIENRFVGKEYKNYWCIKLSGISLGVLLIPILFYTYNGAFGKSSALLNIVFFFVGAAFAFFFENHLFKNERLLKNCSKKCIICLIILTILFVIFTFIPPKLPLFEDPITKLYGLRN